MAAVSGGDHFWSKVVARHSRLPLEVQIYPFAVCDGRLNKWLKTCVYMDAWRRPVKVRARLGALEGI